QAARALVSARLALVATLLTGALPLLCTGPSIGGYADMPLACYVAAASGAFLDPRDASQSSRTALPWLAGGLAMVKSEGAVLLLVGLVGVLLFELVGSAPSGIPGSRRMRAFTGIVAGFLAVRALNWAWTGVRDPAYASVNRESLRMAAGRI